MFYLPTTPDPMVNTRTSIFEVIATLNYLKILGLRDHSTSPLPVAAMSSPCGACFTKTRNSWGFEMYEIAGLHTKEDLNQALADQILEAWVEPDSLAGQY